MKVRIRKRPTTTYESWYVEVRKWYYLDWRVVEQFDGDDAEEKAMGYAKEYANPQIREVTA
jgi:hypothetical protein